jgi:hypothetical protein
VTSLSASCDGKALRVDRTVYASSLTTPLAGNPGTLPSRTRAVGSAALELQPPRDRNLLRLTTQALSAGRARPRGRNTLWPPSNRTSRLPLLAVFELIEQRTVLYAGLALRILWTSRGRIAVAPRGRLGKTAPTRHCGVKFVCKQDRPRFRLVQKCDQFVRQILNLRFIP